MSNEIQVQSTLRINKGNLSILRSPVFLATLTAASPVGPTPGSVPVATTGTTIDLSKLTALGGWCVITNTDSTNYVTYGIYAGAVFYPFGEILAGESVVLRLSRILLYGATGTAHVDDLYMVANTATCNVTVEAFDA